MLSKMKPIELLQKHCIFNTNYDCYVLLAVSRKKDTPEITNSQEIVFREVIKSQSDILRKYNKIKAQVINYKDEDNKQFPFYLYISLNSRDAKKATLMLSKRITTWFYEESNKVDNSKQFKKIYGHFYSCLMTPECRGSAKHFMIDFDEKDSFDEFMLSYKAMGLTYEFSQETKNGYHIKLKAQDTRPLEVLKSRFELEMKRDANLFVEYFEVK